MLTRLLIGGAAGLLCGALLGYLGKCRGGPCPLTGNPYSGAAVGVVFGVLVALALEGASSMRQAEAAGQLPVIKGEQQFRSTVMDAGKPVLVEFFGKWCAFCGKLEARLAELARQYGDRMEFVKVDVDRNADLAHRYGISEIPVVILFVDGQETHRWVGLRDPDEYRRVLDEVQPAPRKESPMTQRTGSVMMKGKPVALEGNAVNVGDAAPDFVAVDTDMKEVRLSDYRGKVVLLLSVPSLDTSVCSLETRKFNESASRLGGDVVILTVSMDLPFAQKRWCGAEGVKAVKTLSDYRDASFGLAYGVLMKDLRLLARAVFVVGRDGKITYKQLVSEVSSEPDYDTALRAVGKAAGA